MAINQQMMTPTARQEAAAQLARGSALFAPGLAANGGGDPTAAYSTSLQNPNQSNLWRQAKEFGNLGGPENSAFEQNNAARYSGNLYGAEIPNIIPKTGLEKEQIESERNKIPSAENAAITGNQAQINQNKRIIAANQTLNQLYNTGLGTQTSQANIENAVAKQRESQTSLIADTERKRLVGEDFNANYLPPAQSPYATRINENNTLTPAATVPGFVSPMTQKLTGLNTTTGAAPVTLGGKTITTNLPKKSSDLNPKTGLPIASAVATQMAPTTQQKQQPLSVEEKGKIANRYLELSYKQGRTPQEEQELKVLLKQLTGIE